MIKNKNIVYLEEHKDLEAKIREDITKNKPELLVDYEALIFHKISPLVSNGDDLALLNNDFMALLFQNIYEIGKKTLEKRGLNCVENELGYDYYTPLIEGKSLPIFSVASAELFGDIKVDFYKNSYNRDYIERQIYSYLRYRNFLLSGEIKPNGMVKIRQNDELIKLIDTYIEKLTHLLSCGCEENLELLNIQREERQRLLEAYRIDSSFFEQSSKLELSNGLKLTRKKVKGKLSVSDNQLYL